MIYSDPSELGEMLLAYMQAADYEPQDISGLSRGLGIDSRNRAALRALIREWESKGKLLKLRQARYVLRAPSEEALQGRIRKIKEGKYIFIPDSAAQLRLEVRVDEILERRRGTWVGVYRPGGRFGVVVGDGRTSPEQVMLTAPPPPELLVGMAVTVRVESYPRGKMPATGTIEQVLGWPDDSGVDITTIMHRYTLRSEFPPAVLEEAAALPDSLSEEELRRREDWRDCCVLTIDPAGARDYDDAISLKALAGGDVELAVHIADVSYYVRPGSALDAEAVLRGNSTYLPDRVLPMLPPRLCDDLCSLRSGVDRPTRLCVMRLTPDGECKHARFADAVICSRARLSYEEALAVLEKRESTGDTELDEMLHLGHRTAAALRKRRMQLGALDLDMPELRVVLDDFGKPLGVETENHDIAHQMIEEFMLAANEAVASALKAALVPTIYRVHEEPDPSKLHAFALTARSYGIAAGALNSREELSRVAAAIKGHADEPILTVALLRSMMRARYATKALGHFGLAKGDYCHFTSPIRRYADLIVHRGFAKLAQGKHARTQLPPPARLEEIAEHISETERNSAAAEKEAHRTKLALYLAAECENPTPRRWCAAITDTYPQGLAVEIPELQMRGFISGGDLPDTLGARWWFENHSRRWSSTDGRSFLPGDHIEVIPVNVDMASCFVDFAPAPPVEVEGV